MHSHHPPQTVRQLCREPRRAAVREQWFAALDGREIGASQKRWVALVAGIHRAGSDYWIQIAAEGDATRGLLLHVSSRTTIEEAIQVLAATPPRDLGDRPILDLAA